MIKILIVDDEQLICEEFRDILQEDGDEVDIAFSGMEAIKKVETKNYDLVFLDVLMPRMEGREALEKIKNISPVPVVIMSGYLPPHKEKEIIAAGALACLKKPLDLAQVRAIVTSVKTKK